MLHLSLHLLLLLNGTHAKLSLSGLLEPALLLLILHFRLAVILAALCRTQWLADLELLVEKVLVSHLRHLVKGTVLHMGVELRSTGHRAANILRLVRRLVVGNFLALFRLMLRASATLVVLSVQGKHSVDKLVFQSPRQSDHQVDLLSWSVLTVSRFLALFLPLISGWAFLGRGRAGLFDVGKIAPHVWSLFVFLDYLAFGVDALLARHVLFARASCTRCEWLVLNGPRQLALRQLCDRRTLAGV